MPAFPGSHYKVFDGLFKAAVLLSAYEFQVTWAEKGIEIWSCNKVRGVKVYGDSNKNMYKGEGRILVIPVIGCRTADWYVSMPDMEGSLEVGKAVLEAVDFIRKKSISTEIQEK